MRGKRPYGISYDGTLSNRFLADKRKKQGTSGQTEVPTVKIEQPVINQDANLPDEENENQDTTNKREEAEDEKEEECQESYIQKFLNLGNIHTYKDQSESSDEDCDLLSQATIERLCRISQMKIVLVEGKKKFTCNCGKIYKRKQCFQNHLKKYANHKAETNNNEPKAKNRRTKINRNWPKRILQALKLNPSEQSTLLQKLQSLNLDLNPNLPSQSALYQFFQSQPHQKLKLLILLFAIKLKQFCTFNPDLRDLWELDFNRFGLVANVYWNWVMFFMEDFGDLGNDAIRNFMLDMFLVFNQWSYENNFTTLVVARYGRNLF